jgi:hypothetical protein
MHAEQKALKYIVSRNLKKPTLILFRIKANKSRLVIEDIDICNWCEKVILKFINESHIKLKIFTIKKIIDLNNNEMGDKLNLKRAEFMNRPSGGDLRNRYSCSGCKRCRVCLKIK